MRLFVSVELTPAARAALVEALERIDVAPARLIGPDRWHITLAFLGEIEGGRVPALSARLAEVAASGSPTRVRLSGAGAFPRRKRPQVLWVGLTGDVEPLRQLAIAVATSMRRAGVEVARRPFTPHLTVARYRTGTAVSMATIARLAQHSGPQFMVEQVQLMKSHLGPHPRHEQLGVWRLGGQRGDSCG